jgi:hypothetical protein
LLHRVTALPVLPHSRARVCLLYSTPPSSAFPLSPLLFACSLLALFGGGWGLRPKPQRALLSHDLALFVSHESFVSPLHPCARSPRFPAANACPVPPVPCPAPSRGVVFTPVCGDNGPAPPPELCFSDTAAARGRCLLGTPPNCSPCPPGAYCTSTTAR